MDGEQEAQEVAAVIEAVSDILDILNKTNGPVAALQVLSTATTFVLCHGITSAEEADEAYRLFTQVIGQAMDAAEENGVAVWTRGTYN